MNSRIPVLFRKVYYCHCPSFGCRDLLLIVCDVPHVSDMWSLPRVPLSLQWNLVVRNQGLVLGVLTAAGVLFLINPLSREN